MSLKYWSNLNICMISVFRNAQWYPNHIDIGRYLLEKNNAGIEHMFTTERYFKAMVELWKSRMFRGYLNSVLKGFNFSNVPKL